MTLPIWPSLLPHVSLGSAIQIAEPHGAAAVTEFEEGPERVRARPGPRIGALPQLLRFSDAQMLAFKDFVAADLVDGTLRFTMRVFVPGGCADKTVWLKDATYQANYVGGARPWRVSFTLRVMDW